MKHLKKVLSKATLHVSIPIVAFAITLTGGLLLTGADVNAQGDFESPSSKDVGGLDNNAGQLPGDTLNLVQNDSLIDAIISVVNVILGILGILLVLWLLYGGILYAFSGGDENKTSQAKGILVNAIIGIIIISLVWALANFLVEFITPGGPISDGTGTTTSD